MDSDARGSSEASAWRIAFLPTVALLGFALPISFLACAEPFHYYLNWLELIPTYGTAWLFLAALSAPVSILAGWALSELNKRRKWPGLCTCVKWVVEGAAAAILVAALANGFVAWLRTFAFLATFHATPSLVATSLAAGLLMGILRAGRAVLLKLYSPARMITAIGALTLFTVPFSGWGEAAPTAAPGSSAPAAAQPKPNILLVTIDTLSAQHMSLYGAARATTPNIDAFSAEATVFEHAYANGNFTTPGIASILTATRPWTHRALQLHGWPVDEARRESLPSVLSAAGYQTTYIGTSPWAGAGRNGLGSYFSFSVPDAVTNMTVCRDRIAAKLRYVCSAAELAPFVFAAKMMEEVREVFFDQPPNWQFDPRESIRPALAWLASADKRKPIFLWLHLVPPHSPYAAPSPWLAEFDSSEGARTSATSESRAAFLFKDLSEEHAKLLAARYDESVKYVDHFVGEFLQKSLPMLGDNTVVVLTSDHGESFSHDYGMHTGPGLYEPIIHIPLVIKIPHQRQGALAPVEAEQVDIAPTIAQLAGIAPSSIWEGLSLIGAGGDVRSVSRPIYAMNFEENASHAQLMTGSIAAMDGRWKFVQYRGWLHYPLMPILGDELYDLSADPDERKNLVKEHPEQADRFRGLVAAELGQHSGALP